MHVISCLQPDVCSCAAPAAPVPSKTALATSVTSAREGTGLSIMLSIICVAQITSLPNACSRCSRRSSRAANVVTAISRDVNMIQ
jgi:hypothetical protein